MIDHTAVNVTDLGAAKAFYAKALEPLGYSLMFEVGDYLGFGDEGGPSYGVVRREPVGGGHVAFASPDRAVHPQDDPRAHRWHDKIRRLPI